MKDLKHLIYFENLLDSANNELVRQAKEEGQLALGFTCYHMPEVLLNVDNCFSVRMRAPNTGSIDVASYYMSNYTCEYCRALVERAIEGGYNFLDGICGVDACAQMNRCMENIELLKCIDKPNFFVTHADIPYKYTDYTLKHYVVQMQNRVLNVMHEKLGVDISDAALREAVARHNEVCRIITEISELRKLDNPPVTGYEFHIINMVSFCCPQKLILPYLRETLEEIKYDRWKKRVYHSNVHRACSGTRYTFSQENRYPCVDLCGTCCMRTVSFMYDRRFLSSAARRSVYTLLCAHIFPADSCRGSLCTDRG